MWCLIEVELVEGSSGREGLSQWYLIGVKVERARCVDETYLRAVGGSPAKRGVAAGVLSQWREP